MVHLQLVGTHFCHIIEFLIHPKKHFISIPHSNIPVVDNTEPSLIGAPFSVCYDKRKISVYVDALCK